MFGLCGCSSLRRTKKLPSSSHENTSTPVPVSHGQSTAPVLPPAISPCLTKPSWDDFGIQSSNVPKRKSSNAFEAVKSKVIRHLSQDKESSQKPQASPSSDEDEIARRAELRRFRAKRIQEELKEDRSKSVSNHTSIRSTKYLSPLIDIGLPGHGPRDAIEFSIDSSSHLLGPCPSPIPSLSSSRMKPSNLSMKRSSSVPATIGANWTPGTTNIYNPAGTPGSFQRYTLPGKILASKSLPNLSQPGSKGSHFARAKVDTFERDRHSVDAWLAFPALRSRDSTILSKPPSSRLLRRQTTPVDTAFMDMDQTTITVPFPVRHNGTSKRQANMTGKRGTYTRASSKPPSSHRSRHHSLMIPLEVKKNGSSSSSQGRPIASETPGGVSSSYYPSVMPSIQPSPTRSNSPANFLSMKDLQSLELSPFECEYMNYEKNSQSNQL